MCIPNTHERSRLNKENLGNIKIKLSSVRNLIKISEKKTIMCDTNAVRYKSSIKFFKCIKMNFPFNENTDGLNNEHTRC